MRRGLLSLLLLTARPLTEIILYSKSSTAQTSSGTQAAFRVTFRRARGGEFLSSCLLPLLLFKEALLSRWQVLPPKEQRGPPSMACPPVFLSPLWGVGARGVAQASHGSCRSHTSIREEGQTLGTCKLVCASLPTHTTRRRRVQRHSV